MKSLSEIKQAAEKGDYTRVAAIVRKSPSTVRMVVYGKRTDHHNIQKTFSDYLQKLEDLGQREARRQERLREREEKRALAVR